MTPKLAVIGGSGLYAMPGLNDIQELDMDTPFGKPSAPITIGELEGQQVAFLARHGVGHFISPSEINYPRQYLCPQIIGGGTDRRCQRLWFPPGRLCAG